MGNAQILVVEDDAIIAENIRRKLAGAGYTIPDLVMSGEEAIEKVGEIRPELVLMDIGLSGTIDGVEAAQQIRTRFDIPVVYLTAHTDEATLQRAKVTEPFGYMTKPFEPNELRSVIETALYKHELEQKLSEALHRITMENISDPVFITNDAGRFTFICANVPHTLGYAIEENQTRTNEVHVEMYTDHDQQLKLIISDNGIGLPADFDWENASSFGLQLVKIFSQQLEASVEVVTTGGTTFTMTLPMPTNGLA